MDTTLWAIGVIILLIGLLMEWDDTESGIPIVCYGISCGIFAISLVMTISDWLG